MLLQDGLKKKNGMSCCCKLYKCIFPFCCSVYLEVEAEGQAEGVLRLRKENRDKGVLF